MTDPETHIMQTQTGEIMRVRVENMLTMTKDESAALLEADYQLFGNTAIRQTCETLELTQGNMGFDAL